MQTIGIIGGGNMGTAIVNGIHKKYKVVVCEKDAHRRQVLKKKYKVQLLGLDDLVQDSDAVILAVKPQNSEEVLKCVGAAWSSSKFMISIVAGLTTTFIQKRLPAKARVIRTMPNMPAQIGEGITALCSGKHAKPRDMRLAQQLFGYVGETMVVEERMIDAVTAVSGSGPAYVFLFAECLMRAAGKLGFNKELSRLLVEETLCGSVHQLLASKEDPAVLRSRVTSKGGTTQAATDIFAKHHLDKVFIEALKAARDRARELAKT